MPEDRSKVRAKARKLYVMVQRGTENEQRNAKSILDRMYEKHTWLKASMEAMTNPEIDRIFSNFVAKWNAEQRSKLAKNKSWGEL
jgi:ABC-type proline/glycine betaine transport system substrate-binding protein